MTLGLATNLVAAGLLAFTIFFYVVVYTMWLKRSTPQNIVIGGAAGAFPPMVGWAAVTGDVSLESVVAVRHHLHVDAAAFLGARAVQVGRLRSGRRADDAGRRRPRPRRAADPALHPALAPVGMLPGLHRRRRWIYGVVSVGGANMVGFAGHASACAGATIAAPPSACSASRCSISSRFSPLLVEHGRSAWRRGPDRRWPSRSADDRAARPEQEKRRRAAQSRFAVALGRLVVLVYVMTSSRAPASQSGLLT